MPIYTIPSVSSVNFELQSYITESVSNLNFDLSELEALTYNFIMYATNQGVGNPFTISSNSSVGTFITIKQEQV